MVQDRVQWLTKIESHIYCAIFNDFEQPLTKISRSRYYLTVPVHSATYATIVVRLSTTSCLGILPKKSYDTEEVNKT